MKIRAATRMRLPGDWIKASGLCDGKPCDFIFASHLFWKEQGIIPDIDLDGPGDGEVYDFMHHTLWTNTKWKVGGLHAGSLQPSEVSEHVMKKSKSAQAQRDRAEAGEISLF